MFGVNFARHAFVNPPQLSVKSNRQSVARGLAVGVGFLLLWQPLSVSGSNPPPSFRNDVMPLISKTGCNAGVCHGNANGKAGFKLSLRGQDPDLDWLALTRELGGRRINPLEPTNSLILLKATTAIAHEGGQRFRSDSEAYRILSRWIADGAKDDGATAPKLTRLEVSPAERVLYHRTTQGDKTARPCHFLRWRRTRRFPLCSL